MADATPTPSESILVSIKKLLGLAAEYDVFDLDITIHINTFLRRLNQLGVGVDGFAITGPNETWSQFIPDDATKYQQAKTFVYLRTRLIFDPPANATAAKAFEDNAKELEWLLNHEYEIRE